MKEQIKSLILKGESLSTIYNTIKPQPIKKAVNEVFSEIEYRTLYEYGWNYLRIETEKALFSLNKKYRYEYNKTLLDNSYCFDFVVYENEIPKLAIVFLDCRYLLCNGEPLFDKSAYNLNLRTINDKEKICEEKEITLLKLPILELIDFPYLSDEIRKSLENYKYAEKHNKWAEEYLDISNLYMCTYENYNHAKASEKCGCFGCGLMFDPENTLLLGQDSSAGCPYCRETKILCDFQGFDVTSELITAIKKVYNDD